jgi:hypothetical protein
MLIIVRLAILVSMSRELKSRVEVEFGIKRGGNLESQPDRSGED